MKYHIAEAIQAKGNYGATASISGGNSINLAFSTTQKSNRAFAATNQTFYGQSTVPEVQIELMAAGAYHISAVGSK